MEENFFTIEDVSHEYADGTMALQQLSLHIPKGKKIALLGHNGAGKSTLFQHLNGILKPTTGTIHFDGEPIAYNRKALSQLRQQVGIVFQDPDAQLFSGNVKQDIAFGPMNLGWSREKIEQRVTQAMEQTEVTALQHRPIHFLSLGQKKRVAIAGVLAMEPNVLILDEPTAGLDSYYARQIMDLFETIENEKRTILLSTHEVQLAYEWADIILVMHEGHIIYNGNPVDLFYKADILERAHLERPWVFEMATTLANKGLLSIDEKIPRTRKALVEAITHLA